VNGSPRPGIIVTLVVMSSLVAACGGRSAPQESGVVVLYTSMPTGVVDRLEGVIERRFPDLDGNYWVPVDSEGISLEVVRGRTADIEQRIADEIAGGGIEADLIWLAEPSPYAMYKDQGLLAPYGPPEGAPIPPGYIDPDGFFVAGRVISMVVAWNTTLRPEGLTDWPDLLEIEAAGFPAPASGAARATIEALVGRYGWEFFETIAEQGGISVPDNGTARNAVATGELEAVAVLDYMAREARAGGSPVDFTVPVSGTVLIPSPVAITAAAPNPAAAETVLDFILSRAGQQIMVEIGNFYPVRTDVAPPVGAPPLDAIATLPVDWAALAGDIDEITSRWQQVFPPASRR
jgi:iron(III) transport system substrate-binding protein